ESDVRAPVPDFEGSVQSYDSDVQRARTPGAGSPAGPPPKQDFKATMPLQKSPALPPRPAAGAPPRPFSGTAPLGAKLPPTPAPAPPQPDRSAPLADLDS